MRKSFEDLVDLKKLFLPSVKSGWYKKYICLLVYSASAKDLDKI